MITVVGAGLAGIATAYELAQRGHQTCLLERREGVALETSYANGGLLTPSMPDPWNAPGVHRQLAASLFKPDSAMLLRLGAIPSLLGWGWRFLRHSTRDRHEAATRASFLLTKYSVEHTRVLRARLSLDYDAAAVGSLKVFGSHTAMESSMAVASRLGSLGLRFEMLDADGAVAAEPALAESRGRIAGALRYPDDEVGDARKFCEALTREFVKAGGRVRMGTSVTGIQVTQRAVSGVIVGQRLEPTDRVVVAAGNSSSELLKGLGLRLPIRPAKGYTATFEAAHIETRPRIPIIDDAFHAAVTPLGTRLRIAGTAEFAGNDARIRVERIDNLYRLLERILPGIARQLPRAAAQPWAGLRPMSADGLPFIGPTPVAGLYVNSGHGHLGWTCAAGSARLLADLLEGRNCEIDPTPYCAFRP